MARFAGELTALEVILFDPETRVLFLDIVVNIFFGPSKLLLNETTFGPLTFDVGDLPPS